MAASDYGPALAMTGACPDGETGGTFTAELIARGRRSGKEQIRVTGA